MQSKTYKCAATSFVAAAIVLGSTVPYRTIGEVEEYRSSSKKDRKGYRYVANT
jgi:hypothetical protein